MNPLKQALYMFINYFQAISVASVASDRVCIHSEGKLQPVFSAHQLVTCIPKSDYCHGCYGGFHYSAWVYWRDHGLVTGGYYNSTLVSISFPNWGNIHIREQICLISALLFKVMIYFNVIQLCPWFINLIWAVLLLINILESLLS